LVVTHEGTSQVKRVKIDLLHFQYENLSMNKKKTIDDMITKFTKLTNDLASRGDEIDNDLNGEEVIRAFPPSWNFKSTTLKELNYKEEVELNGLYWES